MFRWITVSTATYFAAPGQQRPVKIKWIVEMDSADLLEKGKNALKAIWNMWKQTMHSSAAGLNYYHTAWSSLQVWRVTFRILPKLVNASSVIIVLMFLTLCSWVVDRQHSRGGEERRGIPVNEINLLILVSVWLQVSTATAPSTAIIPHLVVWAHGLTHSQPHPTAHTHTCTHRVLVPVHCQATFLKKGITALCWYFTWQTPFS